jgi:hypothetical protein
MKKVFAALFALALSCGAAFGQAMVGAGQVMGNSTASRIPARAENVTAILDRAFGSTRGAIIERGASNWGLIGPGTVGFPFVSNGSGADPAYQTLGVAGGGTGIVTYTIGDILFASASTTLSKLAGVATGNALISGGVGAAPSWGKITSSHLNITTTTCTNQVLTAISASAGGTCSNITLAMMPNLGTTTTVLHGNAAGNPSFGAVVSADLNITTTSCTNQVVTAISASAAGTCSSVAFAMMATGAIATGAELRAGTASKLLAADIIYDGQQTITFSGTQTWDFSAFLNATETLTANITSLTCSNIKASQSGAITLVQDGTGSRTMVAAWCSQFRWAAGARGVLSTSANAIDVLFYQCVTTSVCYVSLSKAMAN